MAREVNLGEAPNFFIEDTDAILEVEVRDADIAAEEDLDDEDGEWTPKDMTGKTVYLDIRSKDNAAAPPKKYIAGTVSGDYNAVRASNAQRVRFPLAAADLAVTVFSKKGGTFRYATKVTNTGEKCVLTFGDFTATRTTNISDVS